jgi:hypothetical protein
MKTYTIEWQTTTTHKATINAESDGEIYRNFGFLTYDDQTITDEEHIDGSFKIIKIKE